MSIKLRKRARTTPGVREEIASSEGPASVLSMHTQEQLDTIVSPQCQAPKVLGLEVSCRAVSPKVSIRLSGLLAPIINPIALGI